MVAAERGRIPVSDLDDTLGRAVLAAAGVAVEGDALDVDGHLAIVGASARAQRASDDLLHRSVTAARAAGASWARIGTELEMSRQAAQQRFGAAADADPVQESERWLGPVTAFDEMRELALAGRAGWHTVEAGLFVHRMVRTPTQWEHRRTLWRMTAADRTAGWTIGCRSFPWVYLIRDTGEPALADVGEE